MIAGTPVRPHELDNWEMYSLIQGRRWAIFREENIYVVRSVLDTSAAARRKRMP